MVTFHHPCRMEGIERRLVTIPHLTFLKILAASPIDCVMPLKFYIDKSVQPLLIFSATLYGSSSLYSSSVMLPCSLGSMYSK